MTGPVPQPADREALARLLEDEDESPEFEMRAEWKYRMADAILARWRLVPVDTSVPRECPPPETFNVADAPDPQPGWHYETVTELGSPIVQRFYTHPDV